MIKKIFFSISMCLLAWSSQAQLHLIKQKDNFYKQYKYNIVHERYDTLRFPHPITGIVLKISSSFPIYNACIHANNQITDLVSISDVDDTIAVPVYQLTQMQAFDPPVSELVLDHDISWKQIGVEILNAGASPDVKDYVDSKSSDSIHSIPASFWRDNLPYKTGRKKATEALHIILHHSASSNYTNNWTTMVRNIYLFHTQVKNWEDLGYNYLITPDGHIYEGRDGQGIEADKVVGAHLCGKNQQTMGICMVGNFIKQKPTKAALNSLEKLITWKMNKEGLVVGDSFYHACKKRPGYLGTIAGHKDGCSTQCPGDSLYAYLDSIRVHVDKNLKSLEKTGKRYLKVAVKDKKMKLNENPIFQSDDTIQEAWLADLQGNVIAYLSLDRPLEPIELEGIPDGNYLIKF